MSPTSNYSEFYTLTFDTPLLRSEATDVFNAVALFLEGDNFA